MNTISDILLLIYNNFSEDENKCDIVTADTVEQLINEISKIKTQMNNTELQLYEANEKIAELIDNVCTYSMTKWQTIKF